MKRVSKLETPSARAPVASLRGRAIGLSLNLRLLIVASLVVGAFLGVTGWVMDRAFGESARAAIREQLRIHVYSLLAVAELNGDDDLVFPDELPEARLSTPGSGLYALVTQSGNLAVWHSHSMVGISLPLPAAPRPGSSDFREVRSADGDAYFLLGFSVSWESSPGNPRGYTFYVAESMTEYQALISRFRRELWTMLFAATFFLLVAQAAVLRWGLAPLRRVAAEVREVEAGKRSQLTEDYPNELNQLTRRLNALIRQRGEHLDRYRHALGDLAHSLKTPLAVMRGIVTGGDLPAGLRAPLEEQVSVVDKTIEYQLQRAAASGRAVLRQPVKLEMLVQKLARSLRKVYAAKQLVIVVDIDPGLAFTADEGDLTEVMGNLLDNACKWARTLTRIRASIAADPAIPSDMVLTIAVEDDGPGFPESKIQTLSYRGYRADPTTAGHGIGLAVVKDIVIEVYSGELILGQSQDLGGAAVTLKFHA